MSNAKIMWGPEVGDIFSQAPITCGMCGAFCAAHRGIVSGMPVTINGNSVLTVIRMCDACGFPNVCQYLMQNRSRLLILQVPSPPVGRTFRHLPEPVESLWSEVRSAMQDRAWTLATMGMRTLLQYVADGLGAPHKLTFKQSVEFLKDEKILGKGLAALVDQVKDLGNEAVHDIRLIAEQEARLAFTMCEHLLLDSYELEGEARDSTPDREVDHY